MYKCAHITGEHTYGEHRVTVQLWFSEDTVWENGSLSDFKHGRELEKCIYGYSLQDGQWWAVFY